MLMIYSIEYNNEIYIYNAHTIFRRIAKQVLTIPFLVAIHLMKKSFVIIFKNTL